MAAVDFPSSQQFIDGEWVAARDGGTLDVVDPATQQVITKVALSGGADVDDAVAAARRASLAGRRPTPPSAGH